MASTTSGRGPATSSLYCTRRTTLLEARIVAGTSGGTKQDRVRDFVLLHAADTFTIADIRKALPGVSDNTIRLVLGDLKGRGRITNDGTARSAKWCRTEAALT